MEIRTFQTNITTSTETQSKVTADSTPTTEYFSKAPNDVNQDTETKSPIKTTTSKDTPKSKPCDSDSNNDDNDDDDDDDCVYVSATHFIDLVSSDEEDDKKIDKKEVMYESDSNSESSSKNEIKEDHDTSGVTVIENCIPVEINLSDDEYKSNDKTEKDIVLQKPEEDTQIREEEAEKVVYATAVERFAEKKKESLDTTTEIGEILENKDNETYTKSESETIPAKPKVLWSQPLPSASKISNKRPSDALMLELFGSDEVKKNVKIPEYNSSSSSDSSDTSSSKNSKNSDDSSDNSSDSSSSSSESEKSDAEKKSSDSETESGEVSDDDDATEKKDNEVLETNGPSDEKKPKMYNDNE